MSKKSEFINYVEEVMNVVGTSVPMSDNAAAYWEAFKNVIEKEKPMFTDNGKLVMKYMQSLDADTPALKAKDIAEAMFVSSRTVSGSMRKLVADGYIVKVTEEPVTYQLTEEGKNIIID